MQLCIHHVDGNGFVANPYQDGAYTRNEVFWRQFNITCEGKIEYPEDDPVYGTYWAPRTLGLGRHGLIECAMRAARSRMSQRDFGLASQCHALSFSPELVFIRDCQRRLVLAGQAWAGGVRWCMPVASDDEAAGILKQAGELRREASCEASWDNFETAKRLRLSARVLEGQLVDRIWRSHALKAVQSAMP
jgi:hypothetical protein